MSALDGFICKEIAGISLPTNVIAYRMDMHRDQKGDMRQIKGIDLGSCSCCDYFIIRNNSVVLVETTRLQLKVQNTKEECNKMGIVEKEVEKYTIKELRSEHAMKIYGSMLLLCRLSVLCPSIQNALKGKSYAVWIIDESKGNDFMELGDWLEDQLQGRLKSTFGKAVEYVNIILPDMMRQTLT